MTNGLVGRLAHVRVGTSGNAVRCDEKSGVTPWWCSQGFRQQVTMFLIKREGYRVSHATTTNDMLTKWRPLHATTNDSLTKWRLHDATILANAALAKWGIRYYWLLSNLTKWSEAAAARNCSSNGCIIIIINMKNAVSLWRMYRTTK
jgi:hypothetical protein